MLHVNDIFLKGVLVSFILFLSCSLLLLIVGD